MRPAAPAIPIRIAMRLPPLSGAGDKGDIAVKRRERKSAWEWCDMSAREDGLLACDSKTPVLRGARPCGGPPAARVGTGAGDALLSQIVSL
ncbi:MAG: hypothetical protein Tsb008_15290 [Rhodothalassiaceae bacterium]